VARSCRPGVYVAALVLRRETAELAVDRHVRSGNVVGLGTGLIVRAVRNMQLISSPELSDKYTSSLLLRTVSSRRRSGRKVSSMCVRYAITGSAQQPV